MFNVPLVSASVPPTVRLEPTDAVPDEPIFTVRLFSVALPDVKDRLPMLPDPLSDRLDELLPLIEPEPPAAIVPPSVRL